MSPLLFGLISTYKLDVELVNSSFAAAVQAFLLLCMRVAFSLVKRERRYKEIKKVGEKGEERGKEKRYGFLRKANAF